MKTDGPFCPADAGAEAWPVRSSLVRWLLALAAILALLLAGMTDQALAGQLGLSLRTVQRRIRVLMDKAGVDTRIQLGWHAGREGWA